VPGRLGASPCLGIFTQLDLVNIFEIFLPQLLRYPNPTDPLNGEAGALMMRDPEAYASRIRDYVRSFASSTVELKGPIPAASASSPSPPVHSFRRQEAAACQDLSGTSPGGVDQLEALTKEEDCESEISEMSDCE